MYCFIGNPPDQFGIAWFEGNEEHNLKTLMKAKGLTAARAQQLSDELRRAYVRSDGEPRYEVQLGKKKVRVTPSATLERELVAHHPRGRALSTRGRGAAPASPPAPGSSGRREANGGGASLATGLAPPAARPLP